MSGRSVEVRVVAVTGCCVCQHEDQCVSMHNLTLLCYEGTPLSDRHSSVTMDILVRVQSCAPEPVVTHLTVFQGVEQEIHDDQAKLPDKGKDEGGTKQFWAALAGQDDNEADPCQVKAARATGEWV